MKRLLFFITALFAGLVLFSTPLAHADVNDFVIDSFDGKYEIFNDTHGGRMRVTEHIDVTFSDYNHGILRAIPRHNRNVDAHIKVLNIERDGRTEAFSTYNDSGDNEVLKIGSASQTITGMHSYAISYELTRGVISFYPDSTEWYWDINGTAWSQPFTKVTGEVIFPDSAFSSQLPKSCYTGLSGESGHDCTITPTDHGYTFASTRSFSPGENLTIAAQVKPGSFQPYSTTDWLRDNMRQVVGVVFGLVMVVVAFMGWWRIGRDYRGRGTIIPEYEPPAGLSPAEVGLLADYQLQGRDISATLIDLAVRGYVIIRDNTKKYLGFIKVPDFELELKAAPTALKAHEQAVLQIVFPTLAVGTVTRLKNINRQSAAISVQLLRKSLTDSLTTANGVFEPAGKKWSTIYSIIGGVFIFLLFIFHFSFGWGWTVGVILTAVSFWVFASVMQRRSHAGVEMYEKVKGLELYMKTAEADRLKMLQSVDRPYAAPEKTYHLFEKLLPFAIALGVEKSWAKQFDGLFNQAPDWYQGSAANNFSAAYFASSLSSGMSSLSQSFSSQSGSSSSGSSGGGGSGGGGGGGGGGGW